MKDAGENRKAKLLYYKKFIAILKEILKFYSLRVKLIDHSNSNSNTYPYSMIQSRRNILLYFL